MEPIPFPFTLKLSYVALSYIVSTVGAFVALTAADNIATKGRALNRVNLFAASMALGGIGIWSMHFIGMLAMRIDMGIGYSLIETLISLVAAVGGCMLALYWVARHPGSKWHLLQAGLFLGLAVCVMHYLGMYGMRFGGFFEWSGLLVTLSIVIAIVAATAALFLAFAVKGLTARALAAVVMGLAVCAMHYTGMQAATIMCTTETPQFIPSGFGVVGTYDLPALVSAFALGMAGIIALDQLIQKLGIQSPPSQPRS